MVLRWNLWSEQRRFNFKASDISDACDEALTTGKNKLKANVVNKQFSNMYWKTNIAFKI